MRAARALPVSNMAPEVATESDGRAADEIGGVPGPREVALTKKTKLHGRAFYESIGSPKYIVAPMVDQSEYVCVSFLGFCWDLALVANSWGVSQAWRMLSRSFLPASQRSTILAYTPMFHARLFADTQRYRETHFQPTTEPMPEKPPFPVTPFLDGSPADRPLFVQFCANDPDALLAAARYVAPYCDAVDLNLGCPQGIARKGHYGAFLQEDQALIYRLISTLHAELEVPVTAKIRILHTREATLAYARNVLSAGASILTVHGRLREQKGHLTGLADWDTIRWLREQLPKETVMFANGNILEYDDLAKCKAATGVDGVMSAEGNLSNPGIFAEPPAPEEEARAYWRGRDGKGGWRVDEVFRRYLDIVYRCVQRDPPVRRKLFLPGDDEAWLETKAELPSSMASEPPWKKKKEELPKEFEELIRSPNVTAMQAHLFHLLRHFVTKHTDVRDALARVRAGDLPTYEIILSMVEYKVARGLIDYERTDGASIAEYLTVGPVPDGIDESESSIPALRRCKRPWWVVQPIIRPLPKEAMAKGAIQESKKKKKQKAKAAKEEGNQGETTQNGFGKEEAPEQLLPSPSPNKKRALEPEVVV